MLRSHILTQWLPYWTAQKDYFITTESRLESTDLEWQPLPEFWELLFEFEWYLFKLLCELPGIIQSSKSSVSPWTTRKVMNLACRGGVLNGMSAASPQKWNQGACLFRIPSESFVSTMCPVPSLAHFSGFIGVPKWNLPISFVNLAIKGQSDDTILSFRSVKWRGIAVLGMRSEGTSENHVTIMDGRKVILSDQKQLHNKQKTFASSVHGLLPYHILCKFLILKVL